MSVRNTMLPVSLGTLAASSLSTSYAAINSSGLSQACAIIRIINNSNQDITISYDGTNDHDFVPKTTSVNLYFQSSSQPNNMVAKLAKGTVVYAKAAASGTGNVYVSGYYQKEG